MATVAWIAGFGFVGLAMVVQGLLPAMAPETRTARVTRAVRTELGEIKWVRHDASDYTALERRGRAVYVREGCWYCHSQYVRPVAGEDFRWGPVSEAGEYAYDQPHRWARGGSVRTSRAWASSTRTTGTTPTLGTRASRYPSRSCRGSGGSSTRPMCQ